MPRSFQFKRISDGETEFLNVVDETICAALGVEVHPKKWYAEWYNIIGLEIALGWDAAKIRAHHEERPEEAHEQVMLQVLGVLETTYTWSAWYSPKY